MVEQHLLVARLLGALLETAAGSLEMTLTQARVLACVYRLERDAEVIVVPARVAEETGYSKAHVSEALGSLDELGCVTRRHSEVGDRRLSHLSLTEHGAMQAEKLVAVMLGVELHIRDHMKVMKRSSKLDRLASALQERIAEARCGS